MKLAIVCVRWILSAHIPYGLQQLSLTKKRHYALIATGERGMSRGIYIDGLQVWRR